MTDAITILPTEHEFPAHVIADAARSKAAAIVAYHQNNGETIYILDSSVENAVCHAFNPTDWKSVRMVTIAKVADLVSRQAA